MFHRPFVCSLLSLQARIGLASKRSLGVMAAVAGLVALPAVSHGQTVTPLPLWVQASPVNIPEGRASGQMVYDAATSSEVLFGGLNLSAIGTGAMNDTWTWNGTSWTQQSPAASPSARYYFAMAYDAIRQRVVLFGGLSASADGDTWTWDGVNWTQQTPVNSPPARYFHSMAWDAATGTVVLFGGENINNNTLNDTWTWDGTNWTQQFPASSPPARTIAAMAYHAGTQQVVLFGGDEGSNLYGADTWTWNGSTWTLQAPLTSPPGRYGCTMALDGLTGMDVLFGGDLNGSTGADTWLWNGSNWQQQSLTTTPPGRNDSMMDYDAATASMVLFGGNTTQGQYNYDTWNYRLGGSVTAPATKVGSTGTAVQSFLVTSAGALGTPNLLTQGTANADFMLGTGNTCAGVKATGVCTVPISFQPTVPGLREGAVEVTDSNGKVLATELIQGTGQAPLPTFTPGTITTVAGNGTLCTSSSTTGCADGSVATAAQLANPFGVLVSTAGNLYIADTTGHRIRMVAAGTNVISTVAGNGTACATATATCGDGAAATAAQLNSPAAMALDGAGNLYIADTQDNRVRMVSATTGFISTFAGTGALCAAGTSACGDGAAATASQLNSPTGVAVDGAGNVYVLDGGDNRVRLISAINGNISAYAGTGAACSTPTAACGDTGAATAAQMSPTGIALDATGNLFIADGGDNRVREVLASNGVISTYAGSGAACSAATATCGDGASSTSGQLKAPTGVAVDAAGNLYIADTGDQRIRKVSKSQRYLSTVAGTGVTCTTSASTGCADGGPATIATLATPDGVALDGMGDLYIADFNGQRIREVSTATVVTFPGTQSGSTSAAQTVTVSNIGNVTVTVAAPAAGTNPTLTGSFLRSGISTCPQIAKGAAAGSITAGSTCTEILSFKPTAVGAASGSLVFTDNSLYATGSTQTIPLSGMGMGADSIAVANQQVTYGTTSTTLTAVVTYSGGIAPSGAVTFQVDSGATVTATNCASGSSTTLNCSVSYVTAGLTVGMHVITAKVASDADFLAVQSTSALTVVDTLASLQLSGLPSTVYAGVAQTLTVKAMGASGATFTGYTGTVSLTSSDAAATLSPMSYTFASSDAGVHAFAVTLNTVGAQTVTATSDAGPSATATLTVSRNYVWLVNATGTLDKLNVSGAAALGGPVGTTGTASPLGGLAFDASGNVWSVTSVNNILSELTAGGTGATTYAGGGLNQPVAVAIDGAGSVWVANAGGSSLSVFSASGTAVSPASGEATVAVTAPSAIAIDGTGGVWVTNRSTGTVTHVFGAALPVVTPLANAVSKTQLGVEP